MTKRAFACLVLAVLLPACRRSTADAVPAAAAPAAVCPIVPVALVLAPAKGEPRTVLSLDANGGLDVALFGRKAGVAKLDPQGCLAAPDGLWAEWAPRDKLWTPHGTLDVAGDCLVLGAGRSLCIAPDGKVETRAKNDPPAPPDGGSMAIRGYRAEARCAGMLLLAAFTSMMPSMAVSDGHPARAPVPEGSRCGAYLRP